jgi:hypothetical protein
MNGPITWDSREDALLDVQIGIIRTHGFDRKLLIPTTNVDESASHYEMTPIPFVSNIQLHPIHNTLVNPHSRSASSATRHRVTNQAE